MVKDATISHGKVIAKIDIGEKVKKGDEGIMTAFLPKDRLFAINFLKKEWIMFRMNAKQLENYIEIMEE